ncbi:hypothetical protein DYB25_000083 [Aphanomyces astaci]|uniref:Endonuclease/exonuclease/phosphatase domain-containing protein n=1 Tax=Aphanomyces astaci TaxID=112090 RepID=A0A397B4J1_APHAT|nr:hypothetical protein DYB25_000083 [Aphanomyces astaci]
MDEGTPTPIADAVPTHDANDTLTPGTAPTATLGDDDVTGAAAHRLDEDFPELDGAKATTSPPIPATNPWNWAATTGADMSKPRADDIGFHPATDAQLATLLQLQEQGTWSYDAVLALESSPRREAVGHLIMRPGVSTAKVSENRLFQAVLYSSQIPAKLRPLLADIITIRRNPTNHELSWAIASRAALDALQGVSFSIPISKTETKRCVMEAVGPLSGYYLDIVSGFRTLDEERAFCTYVHTIEPRLFYAKAVTEARSTGLQGERFRVFFTGDEPPAFLKQGTRHVEEILVFGRCFRVYAKDWFYQDYRLVRLNLDEHAKRNGHNLLPASRSTSSPHPTSTGPQQAMPTTHNKSKKMCVVTPPAPKWTKVSRRTGKRGLDADAAPQPMASKRDWVTTNFYTVLDKNVSFRVARTTAVSRGTEITTFMPAIQRSPVTSPAKKSLRVDSTKVASGKTTRVSQTIDQVMTELEALAARTAASAKHHATTVAEELETKRFDLRALVIAGQVDAIARYLEQRPVGFGDQLARLAHDDPSTFNSFCQQRTVQRWLRATFGGTHPFEVIYKNVFGKVFTNAHLSDFMSKAKQAAALPPLPITTDNPNPTTPLERTAAEELLSLAEVLLAVHAPLIYGSDAAITCLAEAPVTSIAMHQGTRALSSATLGALLFTENIDATELYEHIWFEMERLLEAAGNYTRVDEMGAFVTAMADDTYPLSLHRQVLIAEGHDMPTEGPIPSGSPPITITTCNLNGLKEYGHSVARALASPRQCVLFQETKIHHARQVAGLHVHLHNEIGHNNYKIFINDHRQDLDSSPGNRSNGVAAYFHVSMPGFEELRHVHELDIPDRYMVITTMWEDVQVFFHNVYAPVLAPQRPAFFASLPRHFPAGAIHIIGGDFNLPMDVHLDAHYRRAEHNQGKAECVEWLTALRVVDAWRWHHPEDRVLSGPHAKTRLDYIFVDTNVTALSYSNGSYNANAYGGDHMTHSIKLCNEAAATGKSYWRLPRELLDDANVVAAITTEAEQLLDEMRADPDANIGAIWAGWLKRMKRRLQRVHHNSRSALVQEVRGLELAWHAAAAGNRAGHRADGDVAVAKAAYDAAKAEMRQNYKDEQFDLHANKSETGSSFFFRKPPTMRVPITTATVGTNTVTDPAAVASIFTEHWKAIMTAPSREQAPNRATRRAVLRYLDKRLSDEHRTELDRPLEAAELCAALKTMNPAKSPGPDGFSAGFFQVAPTTFSEILLLVFEHQRLHRRRLLHHQRRSAVVLLHKKGDRGDPGTYRPIALMAVEVKVLSRALAYRLSAVAPGLIHASQAGFVRGRRLHDQSLPAAEAQMRIVDKFCRASGAALNLDKCVTVMLDEMAPAVGAMGRDQGLGQATRALPRLGPAQRAHHDRDPGSGHDSSDAEPEYNSDIDSDDAADRIDAADQADMRDAAPADARDADLGDVRHDEVAGVHDNGIAASEDGDVAPAGDRPRHAARQAAVQRQPRVFLQAGGYPVDRVEAPAPIAPPAAEAADVDAGAPAATLLNVAAAGTPVRFLGIYVGQRVDPAYQIQLLTDRYYGSFQHWGYRARTVQGRRLLASAVMASLLWHVTAVVVIPPTTVTAWQRLLTRYVLGRKRDPHENYRSLLHTSWHHDSALGAGAPHLASGIRTQRLLVLQRLMLPVDERPLWAPLVLAQFAECMGALFRASHPYDFLFYLPHQGTKWLTLTALHPFWVSVWREWSKTPMTQRVGVLPSFDKAMNMPVWLTTYGPMAVGPIRHASKLVRVARGRRWCLNGARNGLHALRDFTTPGGAWLTWQQFVGRMRIRNTATRVYLSRHGRITLAVAPNSRAVYAHLTAVYNTLRQSYRVRTDVVLPRPPETAHPFATTIKNHVVPFERWPRANVKKLAYHAPKPTRTHPLISATRPTLAHVRTYLSTSRQLLRAATPVHADVWLRLVLRMLPVNARLPFTQHIEPDVIFCSHGCSAVETELHAFYTCPKIEPLWAWLDTSWRPLGAAVRWTTVTDLSQFQVHARHIRHRDELHQLWVISVAVTVHTIWTRRNAAKFDRRRLPPPQVLTETTYVLWLATIRRQLRLLEDDSPEHRHLLEATQLLLRQRGYRALSTKHPLGLQLRPSLA